MSDHNSDDERGWRDRLRQVVEGAPRPVRIGVAVVVALIVLGAILRAVTAA